MPSTGNKTGTYRLMKQNRGPEITHALWFNNYNKKEVLKRKQLKLDSLYKKDWNYHTAIEIHCGLSIYM